MSLEAGIIGGIVEALAPVADPEVIAEAVNDYLEAHPEATCPIDDTAGEGDTGKVWSADKTAGEVATLTEAIESVDEELYTDAYAYAELTLTQGKYYKLTGQESTYDADHSQPIAVVPGTKVYVTAKSQAAIAGILFFNSNQPSQSTFVSYDCYTGNTVTYTDEEVTVPAGASYAVVQSTSTDLALKVPVKASRLDIDESNISSLQSNEAYMDGVYCNRLMALARTAGFGWHSFPTTILTIRVDDLREDVDNVAKIVTEEYGMPLVVAACVKELNKAVSITDPEEKIGDTRLEVCQWVQAHGGEILVHPDSTVTSGDYATVKKIFLDSKRTLEDNGIKVRGTAVANSHPNAALKKQLDPYLYGYYDYSDGYGTYSPYSIADENQVSNKMLDDFADATAFTAWLEERTGYNNKLWYTLILHQISSGGDVPEQKFRDILDVIASYVTQGKVVVKTCGEVFDTEGTHG